MRYLALALALLLTGCGLMDAAYDAGDNARKVVVPEPKPVPMDTIIIPLTTVGCVVISP